MSRPTASRSFIFDAKELKDCATEGKCDELFGAYNFHYSSARQMNEEEHNLPPKKRALREDRTFFQETAKLVHQHNEKNYQRTSLYNLTLNQFADRHYPRPSAFLDEKTALSTAEKLWNQPHLSTKRLVEVESIDYYIHRESKDNIKERSHPHSLKHSAQQGGFITQLDSKEAIRGYQRKLFRGNAFKLTKRNLKNHHKRGKKDGVGSKDSETNDMKTNLYAIPLGVKLGGNIVSKESKYPFGGSFVLPSSVQGHEVTLRTTKSFRKQEKSMFHKKQSRRDLFDTSLNWATSNNPDRVPLVHNVFDQGLCGACWAFSATGSLETSIARNAAQAAYWEAIREQRKQTGQRDDLTSRDWSLAHDRALQYARRLESEIFARSNLSIQELIDCDVTANQGCIGGNPLLAFYYMHQYGVVSWDGYPYEGDMNGNICNMKRIRDPVATVDSWGVLPKNHENMIQVALRYIGPVAVGINGGDRHFLAYGGGIFDKFTCGQKLNYAVLIVGYDEEVVDIYGRNETVRYWIARNSWGKGWGEDGYIRIKRGPGGKKIPGMCGLARNPSIALGGRTLLQVSWKIGRSDGRDSNITRTAPLPKSSDPWIDDSATPSFSIDRNWIFKHGGDQNFIDEGQRRGANYYYLDLLDNSVLTFCDRIAPGATRLHVACQKLVFVFNDHRAMSLGVIGVAFALLVAWPLSHVCRRGRQRRHQHRTLFVQERRFLPKSSPSAISLSSEEANQMILEDAAARNIDERTPMLLAQPLARVFGNGSTASRRGDEFSRRQIWGDDYGATAMIVN